MMISRRSFFPVIVLIALSSGCGRPSAAERAQGTYVYQRDNGVARVALLPEDRFKMLIELGGRGRGMDGTYALRADTIVLTNAGGAQIQGLVTDTALLLYMGGADLVTFKKQQSSLDTTRQAR